MKRETKKYPRMHLEKIHIRPMDVVDRGQGVYCANGRCGGFGRRRGADDGLALLGPKFHSSGLGGLDSRVSAGD